MMNAVAKTTTTALASTALASLRQGITNVQQTMVRKSSDPYLRMLKDGHWVYGQEDLEVEPGSLWAANPLSIQHGWIAWNREKGADNSDGPLGEVMVSLNSPLPPKETLKDVGHDWDYQMSISFQCLTGTDKGEQVLYKGSSVGATKAMDDLVKAISRQLDDPEGKVVAVVKFDNSNYNHKQYGRVYEPVFDIDGWIELTDAAPEIDEPTVEQVAEAKAEAAPAKARTRSVPATKPAETAGDPSLEELEAMIVAKKMAADKAKAAAETVAELDPAAVRRAALLAELAGLDGAGGQAAQSAPAAQAEAPAAGQPMRRRRNA